jgi:hypothetical protein
LNFVLTKGRRLQEEGRKVTGIRLWYEPKEEGYERKVVVRTKGRGYERKVERLRGITSNLSVNQRATRQQKSESGWLRIIFFSFLFSETNERELPLQKRNQQKPQPVPARAGYRTKTQTIYLN